MNALTWFSSDVVQALGWTLIHFLWQGFALALIYQLLQSAEVATLRGKLRPLEVVRGPQNTVLLLPQPKVGCGQSPTNRHLVSDLLTTMHHLLGF